MTIPSILQSICDTLTHHHAKMILVGGSVRDYFLRIPIKDYDIEVYGLESLEALEAILGRFGKVKPVGKSFGILKFVHEGIEYDFAFPRREVKSGRGHRGFRVEVDGGMSFEVAARRRDFTINAMGYDPHTHLFLDPFGGKKDLDEKILRHIDDRTFVEDPLRVYRGVQFCARFELQMHASTKSLCREMTRKGMLEELPKERIFDEMQKLLLKARKPSIGLNLLKELEVLQYYPPLLTRTPSQWRNMLRCVDVMAVLKPDNAKKALILMLAALCVECREEEVECLLYIWSDEHKMIEAVKQLVAHVQSIDTIYRIGGEEADTRVRTLATKVNLQDLILLAKAHYLATASHASKRGEISAYPAGEWLTSRAKALGVLDGPLPPLLGGKDLLDHFHLTPSPKFKEILDRVYALQLEGKITCKEQALAYVRNILKMEKI